MARIPTAANVAQAPSVSDPGVRVPARGQEVAQAGFNIGSDLSNIAQRRRRVSEAVDRTMKESRAREYAFRAFNDWQSSGDMTDEESVGKFVREVESEFSSMLRDHSGDEESRARLQAQLEEIRLDTIFKASTASTMARREVLVSDLERRQSETIGTVFQSATALDDVMADYDERLDDVSDALGDVVTQRLRTQARATFVKAAMDGAIARGDLGTVNTLLSDRSPYRQYLTPEASTVYRAQLSRAQNTQAKLTAGQSNILFAEQIGLTLSPEQKAAMLGAPVMSAVDDRTPGEKTLASLERNGVSVTQEQRAQILGLPAAPVSEDTRTAAEKNLAAAERLGVPLTGEQKAAILGAPVASAQDTRTQGEKTLAALEAAGVEVPPDKKARILGMPEDVDTRTPGQKTLAALESAGVSVTEAQKARILGMPEEDAPPESDFEVALRDRANLLGTSVEALPRSEKEAVWESVYGEGGKPFAGKDSFERMQNFIIPQLEDYATGRLTEVQDLALETAVVRMASDRYTPSGEVIPGSLPPAVLRALMRRGKQFDPNTNTIVQVQAPPAVAPVAPVEQALSPIGTRRSDLVTQERNPELGVMNGAPPGAGAERPPAPQNPMEMSDMEILKQAAKWAEGDDAADLAGIARMDLFGNAENIAGPGAAISRGLYAIPEIGGLLSSGEATQAEANTVLITRILSRVQQQSPRFAATELMQIVDETRDMVGAKFWDNTERYRTGVVALDNMLAGLEEKSRAEMKDRNLDREERSRGAKMLQDLEFVRAALGVKKLPHPETRAEVEALPPGTTFIYGGRHHVRQ